MAFGVSVRADSVCPKKSRVQYPLILTYHDLVAAAKDKASPQDFTVSEFEAHMQTLVHEGYQFHSLRELYESIKQSKALPAKSVIVTFDEGYAGEFEGYKALKKRQLKAAFFVMPAWIGRKNDTREHMNWSQIGEIRRSPLFEVASQTLTHPDLKTLGEESLHKELKSAKDKIYGPRPTLPTYLAYPFGYFDRTVARLAGEYYALAFTYTNDPLGTPDLDFSIDRCFQIPRLAVERGLENPEKFMLKVKYFESQLLKYEEAGVRTPSSIDQPHPLRSFSGRF